MWGRLTVIGVLVSLCSATTDTECGADLLTIIGWESEARPTSDSVGYTFVISGEEKEIPCDGKVIAWNYYATVAQPFRMIVWRRTPSPTQFSVVGINDIPAGAINKAVTFSVPKEQRIEVRKGDLIGIAFNEVNAKVQFTNGGAAAFETRWYRDSNPNDLQPGQIATTNGMLDRSWSFSTQVLGSPSYQSSFSTDENGKTIYQVLAEGKAMLELVAEFPNED